MIQRIHRFEIFCWLLLQADCSSVRLVLCDFNSARDVNGAMASPQGCEAINTCISAYIYCTVHVFKVFLIKGLTSSHWACLFCEFHTPKILLNPQSPNASTTSFAWKATTIFPGFYGRKRTIFCFIGPAMLNWGFEFDISRHSVCRPGVTAFPGYKSVFMARGHRWSERGFSCMAVITMVSRSGTGIAASFPPTIRGHTHSGVTAFDVSTSHHYSPHFRR